MKFFFDNQLPPHLANAIAALVKPAGDQVIHLRDRFAPNTPDVEWIQSLAMEGGWIVICGDMEILRTRAEKPVWKEAELIGFFLKAGWINLVPFEQAWRLVKIWPNITAQAKLAAPGSTYSISVKSLKIETL